MASSSSPSSSIMKSSSSSSSRPSRTCLCAPTTHPGSFRCSLHRNNNRRLSGRSAGGGGGGSSLASQMGSKCDAKSKSLRDLLMQIIKPSSHDLYRRRNFQPKPSRFCLMCAGGQDVAVI